MAPVATPAQTGRSLQTAASPLPALLPLSHTGCFSLGWYLVLKTWLVSQKREKLIWIILEEKHAIILLLCIILLFDILLYYWIDDYIASLLHMIAKQRWGGLEAEIGEAPSCPLGHWAQPGHAVCPGGAQPCTKKYRDIY